MEITDPQSFNRYTYVNNNPVNAVDPLGLALMDIIQAEQRHDGYLQEGLALRAFNDALARGDLTACRAILAANPTIGYEVTSSNNPNEESAEHQDPEPQEHKPSGSQHESGSAVDAHEAQPAQEPAAEPPIDPCSTALLVPLDSDVQVNWGGRARDLFSPDFARELSAAIRELNGLGIVPIIRSAYRTNADQQRMRAGGSGPRPAAALGLSRHQSGNAVDISQSTPHFATVVRVMERRGFEWGGRWRGRNYDPPHFEITPAQMRPRGTPQFAAAHSALARRAENYFNQCFVQVR
jgi:LAS superfamily LD-carboxypeptidase LdcB